MQLESPSTVSPENDSPIETEIIDPQEDNSIITSPKLAPSLKYAQKKR